MSAIRVMGNADTRPASGTNTVRSGEACRHRHGGPALRQPSFKWNGTDKYAELSFEIEVTDILQAKT